MQKSEFPKMRHYVGFWQIQSQIFMDFVGFLSMIIKFMMFHYSVEGIIFAAPAF